MWGKHHSCLVHLIWREPGSKSYVGQEVNQCVSVPPNFAIRWHDWSISERRLVHRQFQWSATDEIMTQTWFFSGNLINSGQGEIACQCRTKTALLLFWQLVWSTCWYSVFQFSPSQIPQQINIITTQELILFLCVWRGTGGHEAPLSSNLIFPSFYTWHI